MGLAALIFEIFSKKNFGEVPDPFELPTSKNSKYLLKSGVLKILEQVTCPSWSSPWLKLLYTEVLTLSTRPKWKRVQQFHQEF